jgi:4-hydroxy-3-methylbut-2-enyl diphosphate reductase
MKQFEIPLYYRSPVISKIKLLRKSGDPRKKDFSPTILDLGPVKFKIARHFGFCYGVENAIEIAYKTIEENPGKRIFLLSEMIHNPLVNLDLQSRGVNFLMDTAGKHLIDWDTLSPDDIVIIPAFGTTLEIQEGLAARGIDAYKFNTTCPFVEKVWNRSSQLGIANHTIIIHGKYYHEETRATFSHSIKNAPSVIVRDAKETKYLSDIILGKIPPEKFYKIFEGKYSAGFDVIKDLNRIGVVNQTTMLAAETEAIANELKNAMAEKYGIENLQDHFADTRDTLCYATNDNQEATYALLKENADLAIVVGGYNSSNTSHLVELCEEKIKTYFISSAEKIISGTAIHHFDLETKKEVTTENYLPDREPAEIMITSGASCPDAVVDEVIQKIIFFFPGASGINEALEKISSALSLH